MPSFPYEPLPQAPQPRSPWRTVFAMYATRHIRRRSVIIVILLANIPTIVGAVLLYLIGQGKQIGPLSGSLPAINLRMARPFVDNFLTATAILGAIVGPPTIAGGRRAGAVVFHLIRPMTARQFVIGHWVAVSSVLCTVGLLPMTVLFLFARLVIPAEVVGTLPWIGVVRVMLFGVVTAAIVGMMVVAVSAVAGSSRGAFLLWLLAYFGSKLAMDVVRTAKMGDVARCISLPDMLKQLATYVLEGGSRFEGCGPWWMLVGGVVVAVSVFILSRGVSAVERT